MSEALTTVPLIDCDSHVTEPPDDVIEKVFWGNAARLYNITKPE